MLEDIQSYLVAHGIGVLPGNNTDWSIFIRKMPDDKTAPDQIIGLYSQPGQDPQDNVAYPRLTVYVRSKPNESNIAYTKLRSIYTALHTTFDEVGADYVSILAHGSEPLDLGQDTKFRQVLSWSFEVIKHVS